MLRKAFGWLIAALIAVGLSGCFDGDNDKPKPAVLTQQPSNASVTAGATATFTVTATGKKLTYQWQRGTTAIAGATGASYTTPATTVADDGATFRVVVTNKGGSVTSSAATLTVNVPPAITTQPVNVTVAEGATATFSATATGSRLTYQWQRGATNIPGATSATYTTPVTTGADDGATFRVVVTNAAGTATSSAATLSVDVPPAITTQPANASVDEGATATFSAVATGTRLSYQWQRGTTDIAGATSATYTTPATAATDDGATFRVVVTNAVGSVTSNAATLAVAVVPVTPPSTFRTTPMVSDFAQGGMALKADGTVWAWGLNSSGESGQGNFVVTPSPVQVLTATGPLTRIVKISAGLTYALALDADGNVWTWGESTTLALQTPQTTTSIALAQRVYTAAGGVPLADVVDVAAGHFVSAVALSDGRVLAWGEGGEGSTGQGTTVASRVAYPTVVPGLAGVVEVAAAYDAVHARTADGRVYQWGVMRGGTPGSSLSPSTGTPTLVAGISSAVRIATSRDTALAILADGTARIWGSTTWDGVTGTGSGNCVYNALSPTAIPRPSNDASSFTSINAILGSAQFVFNGRLYQLGEQIEVTATNDVCTRRLEVVAGPDNIVGVARSWGPRTHVWTADGWVYGLGPNTDYNLGVGNNTNVDGFRELPGFNLLGDAPTAPNFLTIDFDGALPASVSPGTAAVTGVQGFAGLGPVGRQFAGNMLRSATGNVVTVTLTNLPAHTSVNLAFLFAAIDSLDGAGAFPAGDYLKITLDGTTIFRESFANATTSQVQTYLPPPGVELARRVDLGFEGPGSFYTDSAYDMGADPQFQLIPHTASTLTLTFEIESSALQGLNDESWGIDDLRISLNP